MVAVHDDAIFVQQLELQFDVGQWLSRRVFELAGDQEKRLTASASAEKGGPLAAMRNNADGGIRRDDQ